VNKNKKFSGYKMSITWEELKHQISPLDLIFFRGRNVISGAIAYFECRTTGRCDYTHVGLVINSEICPDITQLEKGKWYIWESVVSQRLDKGRPPDVVSGKGRSGVQIRDLKDVIQEYKGDVAWSKLTNNPCDDLNRIIRKIRQLYDQHGQRNYDYNCLSLLSSVCPKLRPLRNAFGKITGSSVLGDKSMRGHKITQWMFCSEFVAVIYRGLGLIDVDPRNVIPVDFLGVDVDGMPMIVDEPIQIIDS